MPLISTAFLIVNFLIAPQVALAGEREVTVAGGTYRPFFREKDEPDKIVTTFVIDKYPVTNRDFAKFLKQNKRWQPSQIPELFSAPTYLQHWKNGKHIATGEENFPITNITWFVARKYCESQGKRLPTTDEWEFASDGQKPENLDLILNWYSTPNQLAQVQSAKPNSLGVYGMHGLIWEWVEDFSSSIIVGDSRNGNDTSANLFCGAGALKAKDPSQYATFMRFAFRSSLKAGYTGPILGFRCVKNLEP